MHTCTYVYSIYYIHVRVCKYYWCKNAHNWGERERAPYLDEVNGSHVCPYIRTCPMIMRTSGAYSPCDSYACTCAVVTAVRTPSKLHELAGCAVSQEQAL